jgi:hypothetical protein
MDTEWICKGFIETRMDTDRHGWQKRLNKDPSVVELKK